MAAGVPVLATALPSLMEVLSDGENAVLASSDRPEHLAAGLRRLLSDDALRARLAARAREDAAGRTWTERARRIAVFAGADA
jgi:D-inositol-3-phosphate glycosyltransferase